MGYTKYGEFIRVLRIKHHEIMADTAKLLDCMVSFVSSVESGKKNVPESWAPILIEHYHLTEDEQKELLDAKMNIHDDLGEALLISRMLE